LSRRRRYGALRSQRADPTFQIDALRRPGAPQGPLAEQSVAWDKINGVTTLKTGSAIWLNQSTPWAFFTVEDIVFNVDVQEYIRQKGP
jgi:hypothetical protein